MSVTREFIPSDDGLKCHHNVFVVCFQFNELCLLQDASWACSLF